MLRKNEATPAFDLDRRDVTNGMVFGEQFTKIKVSDRIPSEFSGSGSDFWNYAEALTFREDKEKAPESFMRFVSSIAAATLLNWTCLAWAQEQSPPPPPEYGANSSDTFLVARTRGTDRQEAAIAKAGKGSQLTAITSLVRVNLRPKQPKIRISGATPETLLNLDVRAVAQFLVLAGFSPNDLAPGKPDSLAVIESADRIVLGRATLADAVRVTPTIVVADLTRVENDVGPDDGFRSTAMFTVVESLKGEFAPGTALRLRQRSGIASGEAYLISSELRPDQSGRYVLFVSGDAYNVRSKGNKRSAQGQVVRILAPYGVDGEVLRATSEGQPGDTNINALRSLTK